jgi:phospholipase C
MAVSRRGFVKGALGASGALLMGQRLGRPDAAGAVTRAAPTTAPTPLPSPATSGIDHVVVVMMENRSFDHFLGWLPNARGRQGGLRYADPSGNLHPTYHLHQLNGCGYNDPDHSYDGGRLQYNGGKANGFLIDTANDLYAIGYYTAADRPFMSKLALNYTSCDHYFCSILGPTYPNRFFQHAARTDRLDNTMATSTLPTIWDQLNLSGGPTGRYYYNDVPFLALWGQKYLSIADHYSQFLTDASAGNLPNVAFVDPRFNDESTGTSGDDHPRADIRAGDAFLSEVFHAVASGPQWNRTVLVVNYDEWGGFFDHVVPPRITAAVPVGASPGSGIDKDLNSQGQVLAGFRVPCIIASPFTKGHPLHPSVAHGLYDHTSVLKLIEWRWGLKPLTQRDASTSPTDPGNLASALRFGRPDATVPALPNLPPFVFAGCSASASVASSGGAPARPASAPSSEDDTWAGLRASPLMAGWR